MKVLKHLFVAIALLVCGAAHAACTGSSPTWTATADQSSISTCITNASSGDTINIGAGTATFTSAITVAKSLNIIGAGTSSTIIGGNVAAFDLNMGATNCVRFSGVGFTGNGGGGLFESSGELFKIRIRGTTNCLRVDHLDFTNVGPHAVYVGLWSVVLKQPRILFDHITFTCAAGSHGGSFCRFLKAECHNSTWTQPDRAGGDEFIFIEDSTFTWSGATDTNYGVTDTEYACRMVVRYNNINGGGVQHHDFGSTESARGNRFSEIYNNTFTCGSISDCGSIPSIGLRGGGYLVYNNAFPTGMGWTGSTTYAQVYRGSVGNSSYVGTGYINGNCGATPVKACNAKPTGSFFHCSVAPFTGLGYSGSTCSGGTSTLTATSAASCAANEYLSDIDRVDGGTDTTGYPCRDQTGRGQEEASPGRRQRLSPVYWWNNTKGGSPVSMTSGDNLTNYFIVNRDFCSISTPSSSGSASTGITYSMPACGTGTAPWGKRNAWSYKSFPYPHPWQANLRLPPNAPTNLRSTP